MEMINIYDLSVFGNRLNYIKSAMLLLNIYIQKKDTLNRIEIKKDDIANVLGKSRRTVTNWIIKLARCGAIKYKYSGSTRLNPYFSFDGTATQYEEAISEWNSFESDIKMIEN